MQKFDLKAYARAGAAARLGELDQERNAILAAFPDLRRPTGRRGRPDRVAAAEPSPMPKKRRRMSKEARRRISEAQKKRWAAQKAKK